MDITKDSIQHWYLHVDLDAFFASVEQLDNPDLRGKPVIVGGKPEDRRSVVSTASYEARAFGVHSAMPVFQAYKLCPQGIFVHGRMHRYAELSHQIMQIFRDYSPDVDQMSIDEAFIDLTGTEKLFGAPEETARAIKARVKKETGLTVSIGLARTKYLAKIASGLSKPDGFFHIKAGTEESFMLNLPLNKVWGLGPKSLELIRSKGFSTTRDLYERDYDTLEFLFGKNMATFLYNVVRGQEKESFSRETKSHSISSENTFPYDLTDIYTIETELLELAQGVFFRLLKEESFSRTAFVKIRYDDFSTTTVQETVEQNIITLDSYYAIIKRLFEKKYLNGRDNGRGIRLLGVGFENISRKENSYQQNLFSIDNDEKKQAVEKAILKLSKKHPEIKISRARTLKALAMIFLLSFTAKAQAEATAKDETTAVTEVPAGTEATAKDEAPAGTEAPVYLFDYEINDKNHVDFTASGLWKADFTSGIDFTFGKGTAFAAAPSIPVFKQETDISFELLLNNHWYFQAAFADEFTRNTFAFGYKGENLVRHFRLANRGIGMSSGYSAEHFGYALQTGDNQAPGLFLQLSSPSEKVKADFLVRYDMTESKSDIYYGMNKVSDTKLSVENFAYGREFHFPPSAAQLLFEIENVFVEDSSGTFYDSRDRRYRKLRRDEYTVARTSETNLQSESRLFISPEAGGDKNSKNEIPSILITFINNQTASTVLNAAGSWNNESTFLGQIQKELGNGGQYKLENYAYEMTATIDDKNALVIQNYKGFSPFLCPCVYNYGNKKEAEFLVIADKSEIPVQKFQVFQDQERDSKLFENFFDTKQGFVRIINKESNKSLYPFSEDCPEIYLGLQQKTDISIRIRTYSPVTELVISKKACSGTVQVYKNGILLPGTKFDENTGVIELNSPVSDTDQLLITWQEETSDFTSGALAAGAGLKIDFLPELSGDLSITSRLPVNQKDKYSEIGNQKNSFAAVSAGITFEKAGFKLSDKTAVSLLNDNTSDGLLLYSWQKLWDDYQKEKEKEKDKLNKNAPDKKTSVSFSKQDFTPYKTVEVEIEFMNQTAGFFNGPLTLYFDEDTGIKKQTKKGLESDDNSIYLEIKKLPLIKNESRHTLSISTDGSQVLFDGAALSKDDYIIKINEKILPSRLTLETDLETSDSGLNIQKIILKDAQNYGTVKNYILAEYKNEEAIIKIQDFDLLKDLYISLDSNQGTGNILKPEPFVSAGSQAGFTLAGIQLSADAAMQNLLEKVTISEAGHSIKTGKEILPFRIIGAEDTYRYKALTKELKKTNNFSLDFIPFKIPVSMNFKATAFSSQYQEKQNAEIKALYTQKICDAEIGLHSSFSVSQKTSGAAYSNYEKSQTLMQESYAEGWKKISGLEFSSGKEEASLRSNLWSSNIHGTIPAFSSTIIKPKITFELSDTYQINEKDSSSLPDFSDKEFLQLLLPFTVEKKLFSFEISRTGGAAQEIIKGGNYQTDMEKLFSVQNDRKWFYTSIPFYELFDQELKEKLSYNAGYAAKYEGNFRRNLYNSKKDLIIPSSLTLAFSREINRKPPVSDLYQIKLIITNNSINNFGLNSKDKHFKWFTQEELTTSLTTILKLPAEEPENFKINIQAYGQLLLFFSEKSVLSEQIDFSIENSANWNIRNVISYSRPSATSLITYLAKIIAPSTEKIKNTITRKDSFTAEAGCSNATMQQKYSYNHTVGIDFLDYYNINAGIGGTLILNQKLADRINLNLSLGAKAEF